MKVIKFCPPSADQETKLITPLDPEAEAISGIASVAEVALLRVQGVAFKSASELARRIFSCLSSSGIETLQTSQGCSHHFLCVAIKETQLDSAIAAIEKEFATEFSQNTIDPIDIERDCSAISVVGSQMKNVPGISGRLFQTLGRNGINVITIAQGSSEQEISVIIKSIDQEKAINAIHDAFFSSELKTLNLFIVGVGIIGAKLLEQLASFQRTIKEKQKINIRLVGLANSKTILFDEEGIDPKEWIESFTEAGEAKSVEQFVAQMKEANLSNSVFVDCTASEKVASFYHEILSSAISVVTPNKKANSAQLERYTSLIQAATKFNVKYFYETNVGAGLPVISTLQDLIKSGDEIIKIEAVLSGTLSYIFNSYDGSVAFSEVVKQARDKGYTEPDPRDDLSGSDVGRKLLILAREIGLKLEANDIAVESLVPAHCTNSPTPDQFLIDLRQADDQFKERLTTAKSKNCKLCYIGSIENGRAAVKLCEVDSSHPFYSLSGSDNIISFVTERYKDRPLVVKGPGAGADVTAAGVMADILRVASFIS